MDIECLKSGRRFSDTKSVRMCSNEHDRCNICPWSNSSSEPVHFNITKVNVATQQEIDDLMTNINEYLARKLAQRKLKDAVINPTPSSLKTIAETKQEIPKVTNEKPKASEMIGQKSSVTSPFDPNHVGYYKGEYKGKPLRRKLSRQSTDIAIWILLILGVLISISWLMSQ